MIYFDNSATAPMFEEVSQTMATVQQQFIGNPSSLHHLGVKSAQMLMKARQQLAQLLKVDPQTLIMTSGGTESNNTAILGTAFEKTGKHIITTQIEHPSVLQTMKFLEKQGYTVTYLPVSKEGVINLVDLQQAIQDDTILVSLMWVNNEVGIVQPIQEIATVLEQYPTIHFHVDAVQALSQVLEQGIPHRVDLLSLSAHKFHGPRGVGILYKKQGRRIQPLLSGGGQESGVRSGTENTAGIVGTAKALRLYTEKSVDFYMYNQTLRTYLSQFENIHILSPEKATPHILTFAIPGVRGEVLLHALEEKGIYVSTTSACSSKSTAEHHTLKAMGVPTQLSQCAIRVSFSKQTTDTDVATFKNIFDGVYHQFDKTMKK